jgi:hypothetical protein
MKKFLFSGSLLIILSLVSFGQQDLTLYYMDRIPQVQLVNPGFIPESKYNFGIPVLSSQYFSAGNSGFNINAIKDVDKLVDRLGRRNHATVFYRPELFSAGINVKDNYFTFGVTEQVNFRFVYPKDLFLFIWEGNGESLLGRRADMDGLAVNFNHYREYAFGYAKKLMDGRLSVGTRIKYLNGFSNIYTRSSKLGLYTDNETNHHLTLDGEMEVNTSGPNVFAADFDINPSDFIKSPNTGLAFDFGANYMVNEKISVSASLLDLGYINWRNDVRSFKQNEFNFTYSGLDLNSLFVNNGDTTGTTQGITDSLNNTFRVDSSSASYRTPLTSRFMIGGLYKLHKNHSAGALLYGEIYRGAIRPAFTLSMNTKVQRWLSATFSYSMFNRSYNNLGLGLSLNLGSFQFYTVTDNFLAPLMPTSAKNVHVRFGFNITAGRPKKPVVTAPSFN